MRVLFIVVNCWSLLWSLALRLSLRNCRLLIVGGGLCVVRCVLLGAVVCCAFVFVVCCWLLCVVCCWSLLSVGACLCAGCCLLLLAGVCCCLLLSVVDLCVLWLL